METDIIYNKDFLNNNLDDNSIDLIIIDFPFGVDFSNNSFDDSKDLVFSKYKDWIKELYRILKINCHCYIYVPILELDKWIYTTKEFFTYRNLLIVQNYTSGKFVPNNFSFNYQPIIFCSKGKTKKLNKVDWIEVSKSWYNDKRNKNPSKFSYLYPNLIPSNYRSDVKSNAYKKLYHKCEKNTSLIEKLILLSSIENEIVFDGCSGSGSTLVSAKRLNRRFIGYEIDYDTYLIAKNRILNDSENDFSF